MNLSKIHHIAIIVSDYEAAKDFYVNKLGFSVIRENYRPERVGNRICRSSCGLGGIQPKEKGWGISFVTHSRPFGQAYGHKRNVPALLA